MKPRKNLLSAGVLTGLLLCSATAAIANPHEDAKMNLSALSADYDYQQYIVQYRADSNERRDVAALLNDLGVAAVESGVGIQFKRQLGTGAFLIEASEGLPQGAAEAFMRTFAKRGNVEYVEPNSVMTISFTPNDPGYTDQWHYYEATAGMNLPAAWDDADGAGVVVAVIDTGYTDHSDLLPNIVQGYDFISDPFNSRDGDGRDNDAHDEGDWTTSFTECGFFSFPGNSSWHGTHVGGTVAAVTNNSFGVSGVAFNAQLQPIRALGRCGGTLADISDAIIWASGGSVSGIPANATPASVINMSLGGGGDCGTYQTAIDIAVGNGTTVVVSAGNSSADAAGFRPANCNNVITVAASDREGNLASYSNFGAIVDITAPGGETAVSGNGVLSTLNDGATTPGNEAYAYYQGTSMSAPHISGLAALMLSVDPSLTPAEIEAEIEANARGFAGTCNQCGAGLADAAATIAALGGTGPTDPPAAPSGLSASATSSSGIDLNWSDNSGDESSFKIERCQGAGCSSFAQIATVGANTTSFSDSGLSASTSYSYRVRASNSAGDSGFSNTASATTDAQPSPPAAPSGLSASAASSSAIDLSWSDNSGDESSFKIERCQGAGCSNFAQIATVGANTTSFSDTGLTASTSYSYRVRASNGAGDSGFSNTASATTDDAPPPTGPPAAPSNLTASVQNQGKGKNKTKSVTLNWNDNSNNEDSFVIERCEESGKGKNKVCNFAEYTTVGANVTTFSEGSLSGKFKYRVKARNSDGDSGYTNEVEI